MENTVFHISSIAIVEDFMVRKLESIKHKKMMAKKTAERRRLQNKSPFVIRGKRHGTKS